MRLVRSLGALREGYFARYLAAVSISTLGSGISTVALAFAVLDIGGATDLGLVVFAREAPVVVFLLLGGVFGDRVPRNRILIGCDVVKGAAQAGTAALFFAGAASVLSVGLLQSVLGVALAFSRPATIGFIREAVSDAWLQQANALVSLARSSLSTAGPALGAVIVVAAGPAWGLAADSATFIVSALLIATIRLGRHATVASASILDDLRTGWREFIGRSWVVAMVAAFGVSQLTFLPALLVLGPLVAKEQLGGAGAWGTVLAVQSGGSVVGGLIALRVKVARPLVAIMLLCIPAAALLATLAVPLPVLAIAFAAFMAMLGLSVGQTLWFSTLQRHVPPDALSRISSFDWLGSVALNPIGFALIGPVASLLGTGKTLAFAACLNITVIVLVLLAPSVRDLRTDASSVDLQPAVH
jgi:MFS family permease